MKLVLIINELRLSSMKKYILAAIIIYALSMLQIAMAQIQGDGKAGLVITPTRVELEGKQRSAAITIANNGTVQGFYRILAVNKKMTPDGILEDVNAADDSAMFADKMLRISPRSITIPPGGNQSVRILVRKPKDLAEGEYRTHLSVTILPAQEPADNAGNVADDKLQIAIKANYGVTIPIIVRHGNVAATGEMIDLSYKEASANTRPIVKFSIIRNGTASLYGDIKIMHINKNGEEILIKFMGGIAIYTPNKQRNFEIALDADNIAAGDTIKILYQEKEKSGGKIIAQSALKL